MTGPRRLLTAATDTVGAVPQLAQAAPRLLRLLDTVEALVPRLAALVDEIDATNRRARELIERAAGTEAIAGVAADTAAGIAARVSDLLDRYEPGLHKLHPVVDGAAQQVDTAEIASLVEITPALFRTTAQELMPVLQTLRTVAPDLHELLETSRLLNEMLGAVPGLGRVKRRLDEDG
jgi:ABC-type transporter Mla subunit MlaD